MVLPPLVVPAEIFAFKLCCAFQRHLLLPSSNLPLLSHAPKPHLVQSLLSADSPRFARLKLDETAVCLSCGLYYISFTIVIYDHNDSTIVIYNRNDSGLYY
jgi:hypothetical protein